DVIDSFVDVQDPGLPDVIGSLAGRRTVVVPLLLSSGYHVNHDIARAVAARPEHDATRPLGPHSALTAVLGARLAESGLREDDVVVLGASASSDPRALADVRAVAADLGDSLGRLVEVGHVGHCG